MDLVVWVGMAASVVTVVAGSAPVHEMNAPPPKHAHEAGGVFRLINRVVLFCDAECNH